MKSALNICGRTAAGILTPDLATGTAAIRANPDFRARCWALGESRSCQAADRRLAAADLLCELLVNLIPRHGPPKLYKPAMLAALVEAIALST